MEWRVWLSTNVRVRTVAQRSDKGCATKPLFLGGTENSRITVTRA